MNERIRELHSQCKVCDKDTVLYFDYERFAELIVAEMLQTCEDHPAWTGRMIGEQIKQHFGVEE